MDKKLYMGKTMKRLILIVDDEVINQQILASILEEDYSLIFANNGKEAMEQIAENESMLSMVLLDLMMPEMNGFEVIKAMREDRALKKIPIIVLTSDKSAEVESLRLGAQDFITKPYDMPEIIRARVDRMIELYEDRMLIGSTEKDELTGLYTKPFFLEYADMLEKFQPNHRRDAIVLDIDHFHLINEIYGRPFGDEVLQTVATIISDFAKEKEGLAGRGEADTFYLYMNHQDNFEDLEYSLMKGLNENYHAYQIHTRVGVCERTEDIEDTDQLFDRAKMACNTIRGKFQKTFAFFDDQLKDSTFFNERLIHDIGDAIEQKQLLAYYQPKYDVTGNTPELVGAEALIRWDHPEMGLMAPAAFISLFEENGLIMQVDNYIWDLAAKQLRQWKDEFNTDISVSVNVSRIDIYDPKIESKLLKIVEDSGLDVKDFHIEVTESAYSDDPNQLIHMVEVLRNDGFIVEMDDFGTGYSALNMLVSMPIDILKIDMEFVRTMLDDAKNMGMMEIIMEMAKLFDVTVVAEGVETIDQLNALMDLGVHIVQGYYFSKPVEPKEFEKFL